MGGVTTMDNKQLVKLISYFVMGDGGLYVTKEGQEAHFIMNMKTEHMDYIRWVQETQMAVWAQPPVL